MTLAPEATRSGGDPTDTIGPAGRRTALVLGLLLITTAHLINLTGWPIFGDDEGTYTAQAWAVLQGELAHYTYWYDHPPAGWIQLAAWLALPDLVGVGVTVATARVVMVAYAVITALLVYRLARQVGLGFGTGLATMLLWGLSPLVIFESRQVLLDNLQLPWLVGSFVLATTSTRRLWAHVGSGACFGVAVLTKETGLLLAPALLLAVWTYAYRPVRMFSTVGATVAMALTGVVYPLFALLKGELTSGPGHVSLQDAVAFQLVARVGSGALWDPTSAARAVVAGWLGHDPVLPVAGLAAGIVCLCWRQSRPIGLALATSAVVGLRPDGYLPNMFVIATLPFAAVALGVVIERSSRAVGRLGISQVLRSSVIGGVAVAAAITVAVIWAPRYPAMYGSVPNVDFRAAVSYLSATAPRDSRVLVDDAYWTSLVDRGWASDGWRGAIWYYKLDLDPIARSEGLPGGWRDIDYLIANDQIRNGVAGPEYAQLRAAYEHSVVLASWGAGERLIEVRRVVG
ncbi:MAG TPA: glycosyltransferase family 39 protein [Microlunatus sp.]